MMSPRAPSGRAPLHHAACHTVRATHPRSDHAWRGGAAIVLLGLAACGGLSDDAGGSAVTSAQSLRHGHHPAQGEQLFERAFAGTNGRSCSTCHVLDEHTVLTPANVAARLAADPDDALFNRIDADDPLAAEPTFEHLKKGLVRVVLDLPGNMDLIDLEGNVVTPPERTVEVWRGVPTVENAAITAPYQYDGRRATLQEQAQGAITAHSQGGDVAAQALDAIAAFQQAQFSSDRARSVARQLAHGVPVGHIERPELDFDFTPAQARGLDVYDRACEACHGGATTGLVVNREVHDLTFVQLKADGNVLFDTTVQPPVPVLLPRPGDEFLNIGTANLSYLGQLGIFPVFNASVALPHYRYRFYTDASRAVKDVDLPPLPVTASGDPADLQPALDENGAPIFGPNFLPQLFSTDPGRAAITGDPHHFEAFDVPTLRGIANSAPYFHDNSAETLRDVVDIYSRFIVQFFAPLNLPLVNPPEFEGGPPESLTPEEKQDLLEFLQVL
jgi:cytochrome c peroxidase